MDTKSKRTGLLVAAVFVGVAVAQLGAGAPAPNPQAAPRSGLWVGPPLAGAVSMDAAARQAQPWLAAQPPVLTAYRVSVGSFAVPVDFDQLTRNSTVALMRYPTTVTAPAAMTQALESLAALPGSACRVPEREISC